MQIILETPRLYLRKIENSDFDSLQKILSDPKTMEFWPVPFSSEQIHTWISNAQKDYAELGRGRFAVIDKSSGTFIGDCGFKRYEILGKMENDLGYIIHHEYWGQGYALEAAKACLEYARDVLNLDRVVANMETRHIKSRRVAEKIGMKKEQEFENPRNRNLPTLLYAWNR
ncbi:GNAT family N-acetyltransferase [uncultured Bdellovibrio sp.]|uniref:GNAT family N-acetyltransferase n=1 Tax=Bdellovibrio sp. HCB-162 TaxID=3394234 RepID=UPI0025F95544|nr:GNAT family N-acetyltransferase [uncultured Bdellovibrio sp.]